MISVQCETGHTLGTRKPVAFALAHKGRCTEDDLPVSNKSRNFGSYSVKNERTGGTSWRGGMLGRGLVRQGSSAAPEGSASVGGISIARSVGAGGVNQGRDVRKIQDAVNQVPESGGRPAPQLKVDGLVGPLTTGAITAFQLKQYPGWNPDSRIDPDGKTLRRINELVSGFMPPEVGKAYATIPDALMRIRSAKARLLAARMALSLPNPLTGRGEIEIANWNFKVDRAADPEQQIDRISAVYGRMEETLIMAGHLLRPVLGGASFQLFLPCFGVSTGKVAAAYTTLGGYYFGLTEKESSGNTRRQEGVRGLHPDP
jgi:hypothetical protein